MTPLRLLLLVCVLGLLLLLLEATCRLMLWAQCT